CRGMVERGGTAPLAVHMSTERIAAAELSLLQTADMRMRGAALLSVSHHKAHACGRELTRITHLSAGLRVERRAIEDDFTFLACHQGFHGRAAFQDRDDATLRIEAFVALKQRARIDFGAATQVDSELARLLRPAPLLLHRFIEARLIDRDPALARDVRREIRR